SPADVMQQMVGILIRQNVTAQRKQLDAQDVLLTPDLGSLAFTDFQNAKQAIAAGESLACEPVALSGADLLLLQYTGGTTGLSKGAALSHRNLVANIAQFAAIVPDARRPG
ncbi:AMP-binding protein, partial [Enterobacter sp. DRP3]|nr:AMP-binding protein [Enterobacter sp. DRP3]